MNVVPVLVTETEDFTLLRPISLSYNLSSTMTPEDILSQPAFAHSEGPGRSSQQGLTFRELAAIHIHAAFVANGLHTPESCARLTMAHVHALAAEIAKPTLSAYAS